MTTTHTKPAPTAAPVEPQDRTPEQIENDRQWLHHLRAQSQPRRMRVGGLDMLLAEIAEEESR